MLLLGNTANTLCSQRPRKEKVLCYPAHICSWEQIHPSNIPDRHRRHLQYLSEDALLRLMPNMKLTKSPYLLQPNGNSQPLKPPGQIDLLCGRNKRYESLTFQILPRNVMKNKPALLSGSDCEALGLNTIKAHEIFSLTAAVKDSSGKRAPAYLASSSIPIPTLAWQIIIQDILNIDRQPTS